MQTAPTIIPTIISSVLFLMALISLPFFARKTSIKTIISGASILLFLWIMAYSIFEAIKENNFTIPSPIILSFVCLFYFALIICFVYIQISYRLILKKENKTDNDIFRRRKLINFTSYLIAITFVSIPFILNSFGCRILPKLEVSLFYKTPLDVILHFLEEGAKTAVITTIIVFFADNIFKRIASDIFTIEDTKPLNKFCLYLRSFDSDSNTEEKNICSVFRNLYPIYAIGDPNKILQPNGAERIYLTDDSWKATVQDLSNRSKIILLRIGQTDGTLWEISNIINSNLIEKVVFLVYNQQDYDYFTNIAISKLNINMPAIGFSGKKPIAFFFYRNEQDILDVDYRTINNTKSIENCLNSFYDKKSDLYTEYSQDKIVRKHPIKYMFDKDRIPKTIRKSLNWGFISPIVNMRHWPILIWALLFISYLTSTVFNTGIPMLLLIVALLLFGNRIEWNAVGWSCPELFIRHQKREARLLWVSFALGIIFSILYILL